MHKKKNQKEYNSQPLNHTDIYTLPELDQQLGESKTLGGPRIYQLTTIDRAVFDATDLTGANFSAAKGYGSVFKNKTNLTKTVAYLATLTSPIFEKVIMKCVDWSYADLTQGLFSNFEIGGFFLKARFTKSSFIEMGLKKADFSKASFTSAIFSECTFTECNFKANEELRSKTGFFSDKIEGKTQAIIQIEKEMGPLIVELDETRKLIENLTRQAWEQVKERTSAALSHQPPLISWKNNQLLETIASLIENNTGKAEKIEKKLAKAKREESKLNGEFLKKQRLLNEGKKRLKNAKFLLKLLREREKTTSSTKFSQESRFAHATFQGSIELEKCTFDPNDLKLIIEKSK